MAITFKYAVKYNGKYYPANTPIEEAAENERPTAASEQEAEATPHQEAVEAPESDVTDNPTANTTGIEKTEQGKKAGRQRAKKGTGDVK